MGKMNPRVQKIADAIDGALAGVNKLRFAETIVEEQTQTAKVAAADAVDAAVAERGLAAKNDIGQMLEAMESRMEARFSQMESRMEARMARMEERLDAMDKRFDSQEKRAENVENHLIGLGWRVVAAMVGLTAIFSFVVAILTGNLGG